MFAIVYIVIFLLIYVIGILYVIVSREKYGAETGLLIVVVIYFTGEFVYFLLFNLSTENFFNIEVALVLWSISIFSRVFTIGLWASIHSTELHKHSKIRLLPVVVYILIEGIVVGLLFLPNSFVIQTEENYYNYIFQNIPLFISILIFIGVVILFSLISQLKGYSNYNDQKLGQFYSYYILLLLINSLFYLLYLSNQLFIFKNLHLISYTINTGYALYVIIRKPALFLVFTNKIYDFIIFHKSGILLYSYNFETDEEVDDSLLKGSILIGISHILANFSNVENQLNLIKMSDRGVVFNFDNEIGYALLLITRHDNITLEKAVKTFMTKFSDLYKEKIIKLDGLIDVSIFKNTGILIKEVFRHYIVK